MVRLPANPARKILVAVKAPDAPAPTIAISVLIAFVSFAGEPVDIPITSIRPINL
jgi:hypothetical protein